MTLPGTLISNAAAAPQLVNRLAGQAGAYYQLHREHAVAWQGWNSATFALAESLNKPILLSIGYSSSHWCQDMSHSAFTEPEVVALLNEHFVAICVDQHERPDVDAVYQIMHLLLNGRPGGWPLTLFLCPKTKLPFAAGTYFSEQAPAGQLGFSKILENVHTFYQCQPQDLQRLLRQVQDSVRHMQHPGASSELPSQSLVSAALAAVVPLQDNIHGGFGTSPKFPLPVDLGFLLAMHAQRRLPEAQLEHLQFTLASMAEGAVHDCISGGFFRYSCDASWNKPSFEKMLYDNGLLLEVYARAWQLLGNPRFKAAAAGIVRWLTRDMHSAMGGFYSAVDADMDGCEGAYYQFNEVELEAQLSAEELRLLTAVFALDQPLSRSSDLRYLSQQQSLPAVAAALSLSETDALALYHSGIAKLEHGRQCKAPPSIDRKILSGWNALVIKGLAVVGRDTAEHIKLAQDAVDFIARELWVNQRLFACWQENGITGHAFLDDYAYLMDALLELLQARWRDSDYRLLLALTESMLHLHQDPEQGGLFYTADDAESLIFRPKPLMDAILPAANGVAARALLRTGHLSGEPRYIEAAAGILRAAASALAQAPNTHLTLVQVLDEFLQPMPRVLLLDDGSMSSWEETIRREFNGSVLCFRLTPQAASYPPDTLGMEPGEGLVCMGEDCLAVCADLAQLLAQLRQALPASAG